MTAFFPTTRVTVQRGVEQDRYGEDTDTATVVLTGVPAAVTEGDRSGRAAQQSGRPADGRGGVIDSYTIRLRPGADVIEQDRLVDERSGAVYQVTDVFTPSRLVGLADVRVHAIRVGATSSP